MISPRNCFLAAALICLVFTLSCSENRDSRKLQKIEGKTRTITDMKGNIVTLPEKLERVALLGGPTGQIAYILGVQDKLCAVTKTLTTSELIVSFDPRVKTLPAPRTTSGCVNVEELISARPQVVVSGDIDGQIVQRKTMIPVAFFGDSMDNGISELKKEMKFYADVFQAEERARRYINYLDKTVAFIRSRTDKIPAAKRKKVFNGYNPAHLVTLGGDTFLQERIEFAGCINAAEPIRTSGKKEGLHSGLDEVSMEQVLGWNPDIIVINFGKPEGIYKDERWKSIKAVKNKQVYVLPVGVFIWNRPTAEGAVLFPLWLAKTAYPELFKDISLVKEFKKFYREIFEFNLTDNQVKVVLRGDYKMKIMRGIK